MTAKQRAQVCELLRCAADDHPMGFGLVGMFGVQQFGKEPQRLAWQCLNSFEWPAQQWTGTGIDEGYRHALLEAALRVERGEWP